MPRRPRIITEKGFLAGGQIECDSQQHYMVRLEAVAYGLPQKTLVGLCNDYELCKAKAAELKKREAEEAAKASEAAPKRLEPLAFEEKG